MIARELTNEAERHYAEHLDAAGIPWERGRRFKFANTSYTPDFYLPTERVHIEIIGTRARWSQIRKGGKLQVFKSHYPNVILRILDRNGKFYGPLNPTSPAEPLCQCANRHEVAASKRLATSTVLISALYLAIQLAGGHK